MCTTLVSTVLSWMLSNDPSFDLLKTPAFLRGDDSLLRSNACNLPPHSMQYLPAVLLLVVGLLHVQNLPDIYAWWFYSLVIFPFSFLSHLIVFESVSSNVAS